MQGIEQRLTQLVVVAVRLQVVAQNWQQLVRASGVRHFEKVWQHVTRFAQQTFFDLKQ